MLRVEVGMPVKAPAELNSTGSGAMLIREVVGADIKAVDAKAC